MRNMQMLTHQPLISSGLVRHSRLRPAGNTFSYSVFTLMLPIRTLGNAAFSNGVCSRNRFNLLSFHDRDHGDGATPLLTRGWPQRWLTSRMKGDLDGSK